MNVEVCPICLDLMTSMRGPELRLVNCLACCYREYQFPEHTRYYLQGHYFESEEECKAAIKRILQDADSQDYRR